MNYFEIINLLIILINLPIAIFLLINSKGKKPNILLSFLCLAAVVWGLGAYNYSITKSKDIALFWWQIANIGGILSTVIFYHFILAYLEIKQIFLSAITILLASIFLTLNFLYKEIFIGELKFLFDQFYYINIPANKISIFLIYYVSFYFLLLSYSFYLLLKEYSISSDIRRLQMKYLILGMIIGFIGCHACFIPIFQINLYPYLSIFIAIYTIPICYAMIKYQLMDINIIIKKSLVYTVLISVISLFYLILTYITEHAIQSMIGYKSIFVSTLSATIIALAFIPLRNLIQTIIEKTLFQGSYIQKIEENELLKQEVAQTERLKSIATLASGLAHEIKNPLTVLKTFGEFLPSKIDDKEFLQKFAPLINKEINRINSLLQELLCFSKPTPVLLQPNNIHQIINSTLDLASNSISKQHITIKCSLHNGMTLLNIDINQFKQALLNIILNAVDAMPQGGVLTITTTIDQNTFQLRIQDTGQGIDKTDIPHIFDPFFTRKTHGTGLGLSITHEIIKNHKGRIFVESIKDKGTTFIIELPYNSPLL